MAINPGMAPAPGAAPGGPPAPRPAMAPPPAPGGAPAPGRGGPNPEVAATDAKQELLTSMEKIAIYIAGQQDRGNPQADQMKQWLQSGIQLLTSGGPGAAPGPQGPEAARPQPQGAPPPEAKGPRGANMDVNANENAARVL